MVHVSGLGWVDEWMEGVKDVLRIAYSNQKFEKFSVMQNLPLLKKILQGCFKSLLNLDKNGFQNFASNYEAC